ncbi:uncharacterized protein MISP3 [Pyxicephalus adspersus]|uniref:uncharacterized protein MISP3 n=1 Tax=Pyxicephalus adspersus TaxID=30357 RepID=UPI003B58C104
MASEQIININNSASVTSEQTENPTSGSAIPESEHKGEPQTHEVIAEISAEGQRPEWGADSAIIGESGQDREGKSTLEKSKKEDEDERTNREFSETIEKLDSVLQEAGEKEGKIEGDETGGETSAQVPGGETSAQVPGGETSVQVPGGDTSVQVPGGETSAQVPGGETSAQVPGGETSAQVPAEETTAQVPTVETIEQMPTVETTSQVPTAEVITQVPTAENIAQVPEEETTAQVPAEETTAQVPAEETTAQVPEEKHAVQVPAEEATVQVSASEVSVKEAERSVAVTTGQVSEDSNPPVETEVTAKSASQEEAPQVTTEEAENLQPVEGTGADTHDNATAQVTKAGEEWIDSMVKNIVTQVTTEGSCAGETAAECQTHVSTESADSSSEQTEEGEHSCAGTTAIPDREQVTGAAVPGTGVEAQVSYDITVQEESEGGEGTGSQGQQVGRPQVELPSTEGVTLGSTEQETPVEVETGRQVTTSGEEEHREVTPDLVTVPSREGTSDPGQPAACWEKEWPPLICTGSEVRAYTAEQRDTEQGTVPEQEPCPGAPDMKDREMMVEEGVPPTPETPIEKEIRMAMERETMLRQERGISVPVGEPELVEVRRKTVAVEPAPLPGKERQLAGAQMLREIQLETQREQDLVEQGKVMGTYDRGSQQELQEKKMIFESMKTESSDPPFKRRQSEMQRSESTEALVDIPAPSNHVAPVAPLAPAPPSAAVKKGPSYAEANGSNIIIIEHSSILRKPPTGNAPADLQRTSPAESQRSTPANLRFARSSSGNSPLPNSESPVASPGSPFQVLRSPSPRSLLEREIEEVQERERELRRQRTSIYGRNNGTEENSQTAPDNKGDIQSGVYQPERPNWGKLEVNWPPNKESTVNGQQDQAWDSPRTRRQRSALIQSWESGNPNPADDN